MKKYQIITIILICVSIIGFIIFCMNRLNINKVENLYKTKEINEISKDNDTNQDLNSNSVNTNNYIINGKQEEKKQGNENMNYESKDIKINIIINNKRFSATLKNDEASRQLIRKFPMTLKMSELNANEKYNYLNFNLTTNLVIPNRINAGDIKLYGSNCLVIFFKSFSNTYSYTDIGQIDNISSFISELDNGDITMSFELVES